jgi:hypothetical protein
MGTFRSDMTSTPPHRFNIGPDGPAARALRAAGPVSDAALPSELADASTMLGPGDDHLAASTFAIRRGKRPTGARELARRWGAGMVAPA